jgi:hypothetical protein
VQRARPMNSTISLRFGDGQEGKDALPVTAGNLLLVAVRWEGNGGVIAVCDTLGNTYTESPDCPEWDELWARTNFSEIRVRKRYYALNWKSGENTAMVHFVGPEEGSEGDTVIYAAELFSTTGFKE